MNAFFEWVTMGGYAYYVWPAYALVLGVLALNVVGIKWQKTRVQEKLHDWFKR